MKKQLITLTIGMMLGAAAASAVPVYGAAKQFVLTLFDKPVIVNGKVYTDKEQPILNYAGRTYIPLAKIGELTGVEYRWNAAKKQVEIGGKSSGHVEQSNPAPGSTLPQGGILKPGTVIEEEEEPGYKGHADSEDASYQIAVYEQREKLPPLMSEGWISEGMLLKIEGVLFNGTTTPYVVEFTTGASDRKKVLATLKLPDEFKTASNGDFVVSGLGIRLYYGNYFFNIEDLRKFNIIE
ncbi:stalk domain-containing protein [Paenibacillus gansuensis]|uniref:Stalk domain-containing protein n=1 Tax=Paenibacillus gansuensis TaxID=306542 RepID=A0ABW5PF13_9BACL